MSAAYPAPTLYEVTSLTHDGRGVAHVGGKALFIAGALPGERVTVRHLKKRRHFDEASVDSIELASPERVTPQCVHFGICGGCSLQHLDAGAQIRAKQEHLLEELRRTGRVVPERILEPLVDASWNYRRRARLGARFVTKKGRVVVGFRERAAPFVADLARCEILAPPLDAMIALLGEMLTTLDIRSHVPQIEIAVADNVTALVFRVLQRPSTADLDRLRAFGQRFQVQIHLQEGGIDSAAPLDESTPLVYRLADFGLEFTFRPTDFIQINAAINRRMIARALDLLEVQTQDTVLDLYCGLGNFTLPLARHAAHVVGIEGEADLIGRARDNARCNSISNVDFHVADLTAVDRQLPWTQRPYARVLLDPPRVGASEEVLRLVASSGAGRVVYVSCHPGSLARDSGILAGEMGFRLEAAGVIDMFPHTSHVESIALFAR